MNLIGVLLEQLSSNKYERKPVFGYKRMLKLVLGAVFFAFVGIFLTNLNPLVIGLALNVMICFERLNYR
jgi:hypothetical protein